MSGDDFVGHADKAERSAEKSSDKTGGGNGASGGAGQSSHQPPRRNRILTGDQFRAEYMPVVYAIDGLLEAGRLLCLTGKTGHGKSTIVLDVLAHIANGKTYQERETIKGHVVFVAAENQIGTQHSYITMVENWPDFDESHFHFFVVEQGRSIEDLRGELHQYAVKRGVAFSFLAIDSASVLFPGEEFNNNTQQRDFAADLARLKTLPGTPGGFVICHPNARANSVGTMWPLGGSLFVSELDGNWGIWRNGDIVEVGHTKLRLAQWDHFKLKIKSLTAIHTRDAKGRPLTGAAVHAISREEAIQQDREDRGARDKILFVLFTHMPDTRLFTSARKVGIAAGLCLPHVHKDHKTVQVVRRCLTALKAEKLIAYTNRHFLLTRTGKNYCDITFGPRENDPIHNI